MPYLWGITGFRGAVLGMAADADSAATGTSIFVTKVDESFRITTGIINFLMGTESRVVEGTAAASIEILHAATLVHGDIIDDAKTRRG